MSRTRFAFTLAELARRAGQKFDGLRRHLRDGAPTPPRDKRRVAKWLDDYAAWREHRAASQRTPGPNGGDNRSPLERLWSERGAQARAQLRLHGLHERTAQYVTRAAADDQRRRQVAAVSQAYEGIVERTAAAFGPRIAAWLREEFAPVLAQFAEPFDDSEGLHEIDTDEASQ